MVRVTTWPAWRIRYSSSLNSRGCSEIEPFAAGHLARHRIHVQVADHERRFVIDALRAPMQGVNARQQLAEGKGLGQVVVAAAAQAAYPVVDFRQRAQYQDRRALAGLAQHLDDGESIDISRQHPIHDDHIIRLARQPRNMPSRPLPA